MDTNPTNAPIHPPFPNETDMRTPTGAIDSIRSAPVTDLNSGNSCQFVGNGIRQKDSGQKN